MATVYKTQTVTICKKQAVTKLQKVVAIPKSNKEILNKEIDLIQACITRMAQNSFMVKGWMVALCAVIIALLPEKLNIDVRVPCIVALLVTICFWYLDAFFLKMEKLYRWKYDWVIQNRPKTLNYAYDLDPHNSNTWIGGKQEPKLLSIMFSHTLWPMYMLVVAAELFVFLNAFHGWI